tara:strand:- start:1625 stop:2113 length:489 start_codon:yes stop_codon:yes gene_type:complete
MASQNHVEIEMKDSDDDAPSATDCSVSASVSSSSSLDFSDENQEKYVPAASTVKTTRVVNMQKKEKNEEPCECDLCCDICIQSCSSCMKPTCTCFGLTSIYVGFGLWTVVVGVLILALSTAAVGLTMTLIGIPLAILLGFAVAGLGMLWWKYAKKLCKNDKR